MTHLNQCRPAREAQSDDRPAERSFRRCAPMITPMLAGCRDACRGPAGFKGVPVLMVLIGGLVLAVIAWMVVEMVA